MEHIEHPEKGRPATPARACGAEEIPNFRTEEYRLRSEWATALSYALGECHPEDAESLCFAFLADRELGSPGVPLYDVRLDDARWWAAMASTPEVSAYGQACLERMAELALPRSIRKRALLTAWQPLNGSDKRAFLDHVGGRAP